MDTPETALYTVAAVETNLHKGKETDATGIVRSTGVEKRSQ